LDVNLVIKEQ